MNKLSTLALIVTLLIASTATAELPLTGRLGDDIATLIYDPSNGNMTIEAAGQSITTLEIVSENGILTGTAAPGLVLPPFDVHNANKFFVLKTDGIGDTDLGPIAAPSLSLSFVAEDLTVNGSVLPNGGLQVDLWVPEPNGLTLAWFMPLAIMFKRRRRR